MPALPPHRPPQPAPWSLLLSHHLFHSGPHFAICTEEQIRKGGAAAVSEIRAAQETSAQVRPPQLLPLSLRAHAQHRSQPLTKVCQLACLGLHLLRVDLRLPRHHAAPPLHAVALGQSDLQLLPIHQVPQALVRPDRGEQGAVCRQGQGAGAAWKQAKAWVQAAPGRRGRWHVANPGSHAEEPVAGRSHADDVAPVTTNCRHGLVGPRPKPGACPHPAQGAGP